MSIFVGSDRSSAETPKITTSAVAMLDGATTTRAAATVDEPAPLEFEPPDENQLERGLVPPKRWFEPLRKGSTTPLELV